MYTTLTGCSVILFYKNESYYTEKGKYSKATLLSLKPLMKEIPYCHVAKIDVSVHPTVVDMDKTTDMYLISVPCVMVYLNGRPWHERFSLCFPSEKYTILYIKRYVDKHTPQNIREEIIRTCAQKIISRWWIPICYRLKNEKGEYRMAVRSWNNLIRSFDEMTNLSVESYVSIS